VSNIQAYPWEAPISEPAATLAGRFSQLVPELVTKRLTLRAPILADFPAYAEILMGDRAEGLDGPFDREAALLDFSQYVAGWLLRGTGLWAVERRSDEALLGFVLVGMEYSDQEPELGYLFTEAGEGQGYATEAAAAARDFALRDLQLPVLVSCVDPANTRSARLAERLGAHLDVAASDADTQIWRHAPVVSKGPLS